MSSSFDNDSAGMMKMALRNSSREKVETAWACPGDEVEWFGAKFRVLVL